MPEVRVPAGRLCCQACALPHLEQEARSGKLPDLGSAPCHGGVGCGARAGQKVRLLAGGRCCYPCRAAAAAFVGLDSPMGGLICCSRCMAPVLPAPASTSAARPAHAAVRAAPCWPSPAAAETVSPRRARWQYFKWGGFVHTRPFAAWMRARGLRVSNMLSAWGPGPRSPVLWTDRDRGRVEEAAMPRCTSCMLPCRVRIPARCIRGPGTPVAHGASVPARRGRLRRVRRLSSPVNPCSTIVKPD